MAEGGPSAAPQDARQAEKERLIKQMFSNPIFHYTVHKGIGDIVQS